MSLRAAETVPIPASVRAAPPVALQIGFLPQENYGQLCWAACCAMVLSANGSAEGLLDVAQRVTGKPCSADPHTSACNEAIDPAVAWTRLEVPFSYPAPRQGPIDAAALADQIVKGRKPVQPFWSYTNGGGTGHVVLVVGWDEASTTFGIYDPLRRPQWVNYAYLKSAGGAGWWGETYYAIGSRLG